MVEDVPQLKPPETESGTYDELVLRCYTPVYRYLFQLIRDAEVAADLTQDVFMKSYAGFSDRPAGSPLNAWIFRIATNEARQFFRRQRRITWLRGAIGKRMAHKMMYQMMLSSGTASNRLCAAYHRKGVHVFCSTPGPD